MHGGDWVAEVVAAHGVQFVFTLTGGHIAPILVGCKQRGIRVVDTRHEATAVFAADATARLSGVPGVAVVTAGPGVTNTVTAVKNGWRTWRTSSEKGSGDTAWSRLSAWRSSNLNASGRRRGVT